MQQLFKNTDLQPSCINETHSGATQLWSTPKNDLVTVFPALILCTSKAAVQTYTREQFGAFKEEQSDQKLCLKASVVDTQPIMIPPTNDDVFSDTLLRVSKRPQLAWKTP